MLKQIRDKLQKSPLVASTGNVHNLFYKIELQSSSARVCETLAVSVITSCGTRPEYRVTANLNCPSTDWHEMAEYGLISNRH
jgi:hypothetical protein